ncbi:hypothetical protein DV515_00011241 [Chloebia gouldiae]|uniref:BHLH domain-containing protein n=1 Tax=Chloebia gouldiae TaxID=44316 RepID=A0A3L8S6R8_CHLGU|nr:hypothetical protein DV515_00011241 [Chloebia gouldiae]
MAGTQVGLPGPFLEPPVGPCPVSDSDSDSEDAAVGGTGPSAAAQNYSQVIHSGHFMVSCPHSDSLPRRRHHRAEPELADPRSIDPTLTRLFECMSLEYSGKLVSPKWKNFKGLRLLCWDKIRLNNVIWRAWYIQCEYGRQTPLCLPDARLCQWDGAGAGMTVDRSRDSDGAWNTANCIIPCADVERRKNPVCGFITPLEGMEADEHRKPEVGQGPLQPFGAAPRQKEGRPGCQVLGPESSAMTPCPAPQAVVLEGNYWKRRIEVVMREYHKWRIYYKKRLRKSTREGGISSPKRDEDVWRPTEKWCNQLFCNVVPMLLGDEEEECGSRQHFDLDTFLSDISDTLFTMTQMPSTHQALPEDAYVVNADMIQPDLAPLQPSLDDMDISEIFTSHRPPPSQTQPGYQDPSCFSPMAEPLFSSGGSLMGARGLPMSPEAPFLPGTLLQVSEIPACSLWLTAKQDLVLDTPCLMGAGLMPTTPVSLQQSTVPKVPAAFLSRMAQMSPGLAPGSSPSQVLLHTVGTQLSPLQVPKAEQLSPTSACGSDWPKPSQASPGLTARQSTSISLHQPMSRPGRPESSKLESRRITHISAEQKRRFNIKLGFTTLHSLVSTLSAQPSIKVSKATTLQKTAEYICKLQQERAALQDEAQRLREQIEELNGSINLCQEQLPATGVPITRQRFDHLRRMFDEYVRSSTLQNWKFWIFSIIIRPLFESFNGMVSTASMESLTQTSLAWLDQHCSLPALRPTVLSSLRQLSISTSILSDPASVPEQAARAVAALGRPGASSSI